MSAPAQSGRSTSRGFLSLRTQQFLQRAGAFALERGQRELDALHVLRILVGESPAKDAVERIGADPAAIVRAVDQRLPQTSDPADVEGAVITPSVQRALFHAFQVARSSGSTYVDPEHLFFALVLGQDTPAGQILAQAGVTAEALPKGVRETVTPGGETATDREPDAAASETPMLDRFGTDLTARAREGSLDPVIGREDEIEQTIEILSRRTKNNPVLVGEAGVGKTAIVEGLAQAIVAGAVPEQLRDKRVISLDLPAMLAGTRYRGDFEERLTKTMDEIAARKGELIVFIDEVHTVVGAGGGGEGAMDAGNILKPRLARGDLHLVGATTLKEYRIIEKDSALERRFQPVRVGEPSIEDAVLILRGSAPRVRGAPRDHLHRRRAARGRRAQRPLPDRARAARQGHRPHRPGRRAAAAAARREGRRVRAHVAARRARGRQERGRRCREVRGGIPHPRSDRRRAGAARRGDVAARTRTPSWTKPRSPRSSAVPPASRSTASPRPSASASRRSRTSCTTA